MLTLNILDLIVLIAGYGIINAVLPEDFKHELGAVVQMGLWWIWTIVWAVLFVWVDYNVIIS